MKKRHWDRISALTNHPIDIESDDLKLRNIMEGNLLKFKEEIEVNLSILIALFSFIYYLYFKIGYLHISRKRKRYRSQIKTSSSRLDKSRVSFWSI